MTLKRTLTLPLFCLVILAIHWLNQWHGTYGPMFDEAQYWYWAKHTAWGYYSKPPMIGWLIALSTTVFGDGNFGLKMLSPLILLATGGVLYATARRFGHSRGVAAWVLAIYLTLPYVTGSSMFFTTDVPLQFFWALALYGVVCVMRLNNPRYWLLVGVAVGLGFLSKYTMIAFGASTFCALLLTPTTRQHFKSIWPYIGAMVALLMLAPNLVWNAHHHFVTFNHTNDNVFSKQIEIYPEDMLGFMLAQFVVFGPILLVVLLRSLSFMKRSDEAALLHCFVWPLAIVGIAVSLMAGAQAHWISPVYIAGTLLVVPWLYARKLVLLPITFGLQLLLLVLFYAAPSIIPQLHLKHDPMARLFVWNNLADEIAPIAAKCPDAALMTNERKIAAALTYQLRETRGADMPVYKWKMGHQVQDHYDMETEKQDFTGKRLLLVLRYAELDDARPRHDAKLLKLIDMQGYHFAVYLLPAGGRIGYDPP